MPAPFQDVQAAKSVLQYLGGANPLTQDQKQCLHNALKNMASGSVKLRAVKSGGRRFFLPVVACKHRIQWLESNKGTTLYIEKIIPLPMKRS